MGESREKRLQAIVRANLQAVDAGHVPDRAELLRQHPEFAAELAAFFANEDCIARLTPAPAESPTLAPSPAPPAPGMTLRHFSTKR